MKLKTQNLAIIFFSLAFSVLVTELVFRFIFAFQTSYKIEMWKYNRQLKMEVQDNRIHFHKLNKSAHLMNVSVRTNNHGFRGEALSEDQVANSVVALGDSLTLGWGVAEDETFCKLIAKEINLNCINAGVGNYNLKQVIENYRQHHFFKQAKHVIYFFYINDAEPVQNEFNSEFCIRSIACVLAVNTLLSFSKSEDYENYYSQFYSDKNWNQFASLLIELVEVVGEKRLTVVLLPEFRNVKSKPFKEQHTKIKAQLNQSGVHIIDLIDFPEEATPTEYWVSADDPHPNAKAHKLIAELVTKKLDFLK